MRFIRLATWNDTSNYRWASDDWPPPEHLIRVTDKVTGMARIVEVDGYVALQNQVSPHTVDALFDVERFVRTSYSEMDEGEHVAPGAAYELEPAS